MLKQDLLNALTVKTEVFEFKSLKALGVANANITQRELTVSETEQFNKMRENNAQKAFLYACRCSCVEPEFFTDEELKKLSNQATLVVNEMITNISLIGKTEEEKKKYYELLEKVANSEEKEEPTKEELEKKPERSENSSLN